jgi:hypothetical protein
MLPKQIPLRILKISVSVFIYLLLLLGISACIALILPSQILHQNLNIPPYVIMYIGSACSVILSSTILAFLMLKLKLKVTDSVFIAILLVLLNTLILNKSMTNLYDHIDSILILLTTPIVVFYMFKYKSTPTVT